MPGHKAYGEFARPLVTLVRGRRRRRLVPPTSESDRRTAIG